MEKRRLGKTGLEVSLLGYGAGGVGGLMVGGEPREQERAVARAVELGINYFDTAPLYGTGRSETNLGRVLKALKPDIILGTKVRVPADEVRRIGAFIAESMDASLKRLGRDHVDLFQFHNAIGAASRDDGIAPEIVLGEVVPAFERLRQQGKTRFLGITAVGDTAALHRVVDARVFATAQVPLNLLNPSPGGAVPAGFPAQDYGDILRHATDADMGVIGIRALAGGALSGIEERHPLASPPPAPIGSGSSYRADLDRARRFEPLIREGHAASLVELALRFIIAHQGVSTVLVGYSTIGQLEAAARAIEKGPLPRATLDRIAQLQQGFAGEAR